MPPSIKQALLMAIATAYENRELLSPYTLTPIVELVDNLIMPYREIGLPDATAEIACDRNLAQPRADPAAGDGASPDYVQSQPADADVGVSVVLDRRDCRSPASGRLAGRYCGAARCMC